MVSNTLKISRTPICTPSTQGFPGELHAGLRGRWSCEDQAEQRAAASCSATAAWTPAAQPDTQAGQTNGSTRSTSGTSHLALRRNSAPGQELRWHAGAPSHHRSHRPAFLPRQQRQQDTSVELPASPGEASSLTAPPAQTIHALSPPNPCREPPVPAALPGIPLCCWQVGESPDSSSRKAPVA